MSDQIRFDKGYSKVKVLYAVAQKERGKEAGGFHQISLGLSG